MADPATGSDAQEGVEQLLQPRAKRAQNAPRSAARLSGNVSGSISSTSNTPHATPSTRPNAVRSMCNAFRCHTLMGASPGQLRHESTDSAESHRFY